MPTVRSFDHNIHNFVEVRRALQGIRTLLPPSTFDQTRQPVNTDDVTKGWRVGSKWVDTVAGLLYECADATEGAAVWNRMVAIPAAATAVVGDVLAYDGVDFQVVSGGSKTDGNILKINTGQPTFVEWTAPVKTETHYTLLATGAAVSF